MVGVGEGTVAVGRGVKVGAGVSVGLSVSNGVDEILIFVAVSQDDDGVAAASVIPASGVISLDNNWVVPMIIVQINSAASPRINPTASRFGDTGFLKMELAFCVPCSCLCSSLLAGEGRIASSGTSTTSGKYSPQLGHSVSFDERQYPQRGQVMNLPVSGQIAPWGLSIECSCPQ